MLLTLLLGWVLGSFLIAPFIGRAIRAARQPEAMVVPEGALEVA
jgi:hypothetical protein